MGSAWRGGFGRALKRAVCVTGLSTTRAAHSRRAASIPTCSRPRPAARAAFSPAMTGYRARLFWLRPGTAAVWCPRGGAVDRRAVEHAGFARQAVVEAGLRGLGPDRGALDLLSIEPIIPPSVGPCPERVEIMVADPAAPCRGRPAGRSGRFAPPPPANSTASAASLSARQSRASGAGPCRSARSETRRSSDSSDEAALRWVEWARYSGRQRALLQMGGLMGALSLPLAGIEPFWPFLALAPWVHVGKGATMGLGGMRVTPA